MGKGPRSSDTITESDIGRNITRSVTRVRFRSCGTVGYGPTEGKKGGDIPCEHNARFVRDQFVNYVGNIIRAKGEGRREPFSCLIRRGGPNWQSSRPSVVTEKSSTIVTSCTDNVAHQSVYISRELSLLRL